MWVRLRIVSIAILSSIVLVGPASAQDEGADEIGSEVRSAVDQGNGVRVVVALDRPAMLQKGGEVTVPGLNRKVQRVQREVLSTVSTAGFRVTHRFDSVPALIGRLRSEAALEQLARHPNVRRIDRDAGGGGGLETSLEIIGADRWQEDGVTGKGVRVAVLDTGIDTDHTDLSDDLVHQACFLNIGGEGQCPDGSDRQTGPGAAEDDHGHGTSVSGIITSSGIRAPRGVAPDAEIIAVKVLNADNRFSSFSEIVAALDYLINQPDLGTAVVNMSLGTDVQFPGVCDNTTSWNMSGAAAVETLRSQGVITVAASLNKGSGTELTSPACLSDVVSVGATDGNTEVTGFSNSNGTLDLVAPGVQIQTTARGNRMTSSFGGTSAAAPHAAGCAALLRAAGTNTRPDSIEASLETSPVQARDAKNGLTFPRLACYTAKQLVAIRDVRASMPSDSEPDAASFPFTLQWRTLMEKRSKGFIVERRPEASSGRWTRVGVADTKAPDGRSSDTLRYQLKGTLPAPGQYSFRLRHATEQRPEAGRRVIAHTTLNVPIPDGPVAVGGPHPNPTRGHARIEVVVEDAQPVKIDLYDALGRHVQRLYDDRLAAKRPLLLDVDRELSSGTYFLQVRGTAFVATRKMMVVQ